MEEDVLVNEAEVVVQLGDGAGEDALLGGRRGGLGPRRRVTHRRQVRARQRRRDRDPRLQTQCTVQFFFFFFAGNWIISSN